MGNKLKELKNIQKEINKRRVGANEEELRRLDTYTEFLGSLINNSMEYVKNLFTTSACIASRRQEAISIKDYQELAINSDKTRRVLHNGLITDLAVMDRICTRLDRPLLFGGFVQFNGDTSRILNANAYKDESAYKVRREAANWAIGLVRESAEEIGISRK